MLREPERGGLEGWVKPGTVLTSARSGKTDSGQLDRMRLMFKTQTTGRPGAGA